ncbi:unnamed protein product [Adineta ricciae]|uniref:DUF389 domain-containing protein n=1 Tax=Adineta ricciae TaxID=249248 RepID=A0A814J3T4_ADIRI|nr:unnamed protein product [Adineta ricciae]
MSNDYALFMILLPNDFEQTVSTRSEIKHTASTSSVNAISALITPASIICPRRASIIDKDNSQSQESLCVALKTYLNEQNRIDALWMRSEDAKIYQITFYVEFGFVSDRTLQDLLKLGIGKRTNTKIFVLPTAIILEGHSESISSLSSPEDSIQADSLPAKLNDETLTKKIRKRINVSNFKKSVRARLMVHQVVASIRASTALSFDFVLLICLASMLAAFGLLENSTVIIVASMLVSPLMNPILGVVFGLSVREHSLWRRGLRNELIGLIICISCGFILGLFTTFAETKWGSSTSFPTAEMRSRGDIKRLWVGVLIALPSGAGVALSVLGGNTGSLVGVAISASLLPPAVNCGLLFAYTILGNSFPSVAAIENSSINQTQHLYFTNRNCTKYINNDYQSLYTCNLAIETAILAGCSLLLTIVNIICIIIMALFILRIKEVVPLHQPNKNITNFFHYDVKVVRDYNKTIHEGDLEPTNMTTTRNNLQQSMINRWKIFRSLTSHDNSQHQQEIGQTLSANADQDLSDAEIRRKLLGLNTFVKEYNLDVFEKNDYDLLSPVSREKVRLLVNDLLDMCQEETPLTFINLFNLQPCNSQSSDETQQHSFYQEIIEILPPKWYDLFIYEQKQRQIRSWSSAFKRTYSLRVPKFDKSISESHEHRFTPRRAHVRRQSSVPESNLHALSFNQEVEIPVEGTRFRITRPSITSEMFLTE